MKAALLKKIKEPLVLEDVEIPTVCKREVLIKVHACGVCRTDLHIVEGELATEKLPLILGHQIVGTVADFGREVANLSKGSRVGAPWLGKTCGSCEFCSSDRENLCDSPTFTGYTKNGGYAQYCAVDKDFIIELPFKYTDLEMAPLLCAGLIGFRAFRLTGQPKKIGFYGFGSSAHLLLQLITQLDHEVFVFTRPNDTEGQKFAKSLGAKWAGGSKDAPPELLDAAIIFAPAGELYVEGLKVLKKGGKIISAGIHMSDIPSFPYSLLWEEKSMSSVANLTRKDAKDFFALIEKHPIKPSVQEFAFSEVNEALEAIKTGKLQGSAVLKIQ